ncbi:RNaseH domain-containing protein [Streptomyces antimycoticus]|uniref:RNaseH domain-containing protein n=1 Tax=Streptomyces antimycoticus TaxID=68175 RepID=UPI0037CDF573
MKASTHPFNRERRDAFTLLHGLILGHHPDDIDLNQPTPLAERVADTPRQERLLADYLTDPSGRRSEASSADGRQPNAANWVYSTVAWDLAHRLAQHTWTVDGQDVVLRPDSSGGLIAWQQPWPNKAGTAHALARVRLALKTLPNITDPVLVVSSHATRLSRRMAYARTVLAEQAETTLPIIEVEMAGRGRIRRIHRMSLQTLARLGMDHSVLHNIQRRVEAEQKADAGDGTEPPQAAEPQAASAELGAIRPVQSKNFAFPIGRGVGMHHLRELDRHIGEVLAPAPLSIIKDSRAHGFKQLPQAELSVQPRDIVRSLDAMDYQHLRLVCLWYRDEMRQRMIHGLAGLFGLDPRTLDPTEGIPVPLDGGRVSAVFHCVPDFLVHGPAAGQEAAISHIPSLKTDPATLTGVWAETEFDAAPEEEEALPPTGGPSSVNGQDEDAKHRARRTLARLGAVSQFTADRKEAKRKKPNAKDTDHQVILSLLDLCRSLGIIDRRVDQVMVDSIGPYSPGQVAHCGIHVRRQSRQGKDRAAKICITASVLKPPTTDGGAWTLHGWSYTHPHWELYHRAQAAFHAGDYRTGNMTEFDDDNRGHKKVAQQVDQALADLSDYLDGAPYTVAVDGVATRRLWLGLHNRRQGQQPTRNSTWLPASTLDPRERPLAVVRINKDMDEVPRPIRVRHLEASGATARSENTTKLLYQVQPDFGSPSWLLATVPPQFDGAGAGRLGKDITRWSASHGSNDPQARRKNEVRQNWYSMTATEIYPIITAARAGSSVSRIETAVEPQSLALAAARLCHQPLAWANRTRYPVPLHAAQQMDLDHPQYRRTALASEHEGAAVDSTAPAAGASPDEQP